MSVYSELALTLVCIAGLALGAWWLLGRLLRPIPESGVWVVLPGRGEGGELEQQMRLVAWLRGLGMLRGPAVIADVDLTPQGRELALRLAARWPETALWPADRLDELMAQGSH